MSMIRSNVMLSSQNRQIPDSRSSNLYILENKSLSNEGGGSAMLSFEENNYFTLDSSSLSGGFTSCESPEVSISSSASPLSTQFSFSDTSLSSEITFETRQWLRDVELTLIGHESGSSFSDDFYLSGGFQNDVVELSPELPLKEALLACAEAVSNNDVQKCWDLLQFLEPKVNVNGDPLERVGAYMLEALRARVQFTGTFIYQSLKCDAPISTELFTYMSFLYTICPYWKFVYVSANAAILDAVQNEPIIHIIDFQIAQGTQWVALIQSLSQRVGGPPALRITGVDDPQSVHARGGGLEIVARRLQQFADSHSVPFIFHDAAISCGEVQTDTLRFYPGEAVVVNFPFVLHHMADESVSTRNQRDGLLHLVKKMSPKLVTLAEQESNTNTTPFLARFLETLDYYTAIFESIDAGCARDNKQRVSAEQHCVARDMVNMIACENEARVERHELFGKWRRRMTWAGFEQVPLDDPVADVARTMLAEFDRNFRIEVSDGALFLWWKRRAMASSSAWRVRTNQFTDS